MISLTFRKPASREAWSDFILAVTELFWQVPVFMQPCSYRQMPLSCAGDMFDGDTLVISGLRYGYIPPSALPVSVLMLARMPETADAEVQMPDAQSDFFVRMVLVLLEVYCPEYADITWQSENERVIPMLWLRQHTGHMNNIPDHVWQTMTLHPTVMQATAGLTRRKRLSRVGVTDTAYVQHIKRFWSVIRRAEMAFSFPGNSAVV